jgi:hypothetical protein
MKKTISLLFALIFNATCFAGYFAAGEISYQNLGGLTYQITVKIYTPTTSLADPPEITVNWGDGTSDIVQRVEKINLPNNICKNTYVGTMGGGIHTYAGSGTYIIWVADTFRTDGIINIPNSGSTGFYLDARLVINPFLGVNNSPDFLNIPFDMATVDSIFNYNPQASDIDGDSISYRLVPCAGLGITGYTFPSASNIFSLDSLTGNLLWDTPIYAGDYNIAMLIEEWRQGVKIGSLRRDMRIHVDGGSDIESYFGSPKFNVFPNPSHDFINISYKTVDWTSIEIIDNSGKTILFNNSCNNQILDISGLSNGIYLIRLSSDKLTMTRKIIKE